MLYSSQKICFGCMQPLKKSIYSDSCELCGILEEKLDIGESIKAINRINLKCPICTFDNPEDSIQCKICEYIFEEKIKQNISKIQVSLKNCSICNLQNDIFNEYCLNCQNELIQHQKKECPICGFKVNAKNFEGHYFECILSQELLEKEEIAKPIIPIKYQKLDLLEQHIVKKIPHQKEVVPIVPIDLIKSEIIQQVPIQKLQYRKGFFSSIFSYVSDYLYQQEGKLTEANKYCFWCKVQFRSLSTLQTHMKNCSKKISIIQNPSLNRMTSLQIDAMKHMNKKSASQHSSVRSSLQTRLKKLGYTSQDLNNLSFYIQNYAPIIIQIHVSKHMEFFIKDTHYRSQFQTNKSSGSLSRASRTQWQDRMFDTRYTKAKDFQRVKYGVINFTNDPKGVQCAKSYGPSYFLLKSHVRERCTFTDKDSSNADSSISTLKYSFKIVSKMTDAQLIAAIKASKALQQSSGVTIAYKQLQIHGPIQFDKDIERIYVSKQEIMNKDILNMVYEFSQKFKVDHDFIS